MVLASTNYCSKCKATDKPLIKYAFVRGRQYHYCRDCMNFKMKKYGLTKKGKEALSQNRLRTRAKYYGKHKARRKLNNAIAAGKIIRPEKCTVCHSSGRIEGHHYDYEKPLEVVWLCTDCHAKVHL